ncbi:MAG: response regulator [Solobacterium sp.]|nr:response regulator [Solobacterium sp.]
MNITTETLIAVVIGIGSVLMVYNIIRYRAFSVRMRSVISSARMYGAVILPLVLLVLFLCGYVIVGLSGQADAVMAGILLGGSIFVMIILEVLMYIVGRIQEHEQQTAAMYSAMLKNREHMSEYLGFFRVNLTTDTIVEAAGTDLFDKDKNAVSYTELLHNRQSVSRIIEEDLQEDEDFTRETLLKRASKGNFRTGAIVYMNRPLSGNCFVHVEVVSAVQPASGDVIALITEDECSGEIVRRTVQNQVLADRYDMIAYIAEGVIGTAVSGSRKDIPVLVPETETCDYSKYIQAKIIPYAVAEEGRESAEDLLNLDRIRRELANRKYWEVILPVRIQDDIRYKRFLFCAAEPGTDFYILLTADITDVQEEQIRRNEQLADALSAANNASRAKTDFLANMSHDIRTPMNAVIGYTHLALRENSTAEQMRSYLEKIDASSEHLLALINDILEMSRIESGRMELDNRPENLQAVLKDAESLFAEQMTKKGIEFRVSTDIKDSCVLCDRRRLNRILLNLLSNALKFTPAGGTVTVSLKQMAADTDSGTYELRVKDTGIGMRREFAEKIFEPFERERTSTVSGIQGTGLGMAITKNIVDLMKGTISVETAPGEGSEFIVTLTFPFAEDTGELPCGKAPKQDNTGFAGRRILLAEDNMINREIAAEMLKHAGFEVYEAENGQEAYERVAQSQPGYYDAVLMDIQMPVMNGYDASAAIRSLANEELATIPIIAMTANAFSDDIEREKNAGMDAHVSKPIEPERMFETLRDILNR